MNNKTTYTSNWPESFGQGEGMLQTSAAEAEQMRVEAEVHAQHTRLYYDYTREESEDPFSKKSSVFRAIRTFPETLKTHSRKLYAFIGAVAVVGALAAPGTAFAANADSYTLRPGDNLSLVAAQHHITLEQLLDQNPEQRSTPNLVHPNEVLSLGNKSKSPDVYIIKLGDRLASVATAHNMTLAELLNINQQFEANPDLVHPGDKVYLKKSATKKSSSAKKVDSRTLLPTPQNKVEDKVRDSIAPFVSEKPQNNKPNAKHNTAKTHDNTPNPKEHPKVKVHKPSTQQADKTFKLKDLLGLDDIIMPANWAQWAKENPEEAEKHVEEISKKYHRHFTVEDFIAAIASQESGGDPDAVNSETKARGYTQIMPDNWPGWSEEALGRVAPQTPENQLLVSRFKMDKYHKKYKDWKAVAIAWFAGPARADRYAAGDKSILAMSDGHWSVRQYVNHMQANIGKADPYKIFPELKKIKKKKKHKSSAHKTQSKKITPKAPFFGFGQKPKDGVPNISPFLLPSVVNSETTQKPHPEKHKHHKKEARHKHVFGAATSHTAGISWSWPVDKKEPISSCWDVPRPGHAHSGLDISAPKGLAVRAAAEGTVVMAKNNTPPVTGFGKTVFIKHEGAHGKDRYTLYAHLDSFDKNINDGKVKRGEVIGRVGNTGHSGGNHLHFNVQSSPVPVGDANRSGTVNPIDYLPNDKRPNPASCKK